MTVDERAFESPSAVGRYWLARSRGFAVESQSRRRVGEVEAVDVDAATGDGVLVVARRGVFRTRRETVSTDRVRLVLPWSETIVLGRISYPGARRRSPGSRGPSRSGRCGELSSRVRPFLLAALSAVAGEAGTVRAYSLAVGRAIVPVVRAVAAAAAREVGALVAWLAVVTPVAAARARVRVERAWRTLDAAIEARRDPPQRRELSRAAVRRD